jgi:hypothetical protein
MDPLPDFLAVDCCPPVENTYVLRMFNAILLKDVGVD